MPARRILAGRVRGMHPRVRSWSDPRDMRPRELIVLWRDGRMLPRTCHPNTFRNRESAMTTALQNFLGGLIDYAGLFPPAALSLEESLRNYARYRQEADAW